MRPYLSTAEGPPPEWYDEALDDRDDQWMAKCRRGRKSDALLSCPACLSTVCVDCQRCGHCHGGLAELVLLNDAWMSMRGRRRPRV